jgi:hypothetical protein
LWEKPDETAAIYFEKAQCAREAPKAGVLWIEGVADRRC